MIESHQRALQVGDPLAAGAPRHGPERRPAAMTNRLPPCLPTQGVMGQSLDLLAEFLARKTLHGLRDAGVQRALTVAQQPAVRDVVRERVLEGVLEIREELRLVEKLRG